MTATDRSLATGTPQRLLEREDELAEAHTLLADVRGGRGRMLLIEAPPGFGKSTLLDEMRARAAEDGVLVLTAAGRDLEQRLGWGVAGSLGALGG